jgi:hypothetical protein
MFVMDEFESLIDQFHSLTFHSLTHLCVIDLIDVRLID